MALVLLKRCSLNIAMDQLYPRTLCNVSSNLKSLSMKSSFHQFIAKFHHSHRGVHFKNYYEILNVSPRASIAQVKSAYYELCKTHHPDVNPRSDANKKFAEITEAYEVLSNRGKRQEYNRAVFGRNFPPSDIENTSSSPSETDSSLGKPPDFDYNRINFEEFYRKHYENNPRVYNSHFRSYQSRIRTRNHGIYYNIYYKNGQENTTGTRSTGANTQALKRRHMERLRQFLVRLTVVYGMVLLVVFTIWNDT